MFYENFDNRNKLVIFQNKIYFLRKVDVLKNQVVREHGEGRSSAQLCFRPQRVQPGILDAMGVRRVEVVTLGVVRIGFFPTR